MKTLQTAVCDHERGLCNHWDLLDRIAELEAENDSVRNWAIALNEQVQQEVARAEKAESELADSKERMETGSRWLKAEIAGREKAEAEVERLRRGLRGMAVACCTCCKVENCEAHAPRERD